MLARAASRFYCEQNAIREHPMLQESGRQLSGWSACCENMRTWVWRPTYKAESTPEFQVRTSRPILPIYLSISHPNPVLPRYYVEFDTDLKGTHTRFTPPICLPNSPPTRHDAPVLWTPRVSLLPHLHQDTSVPCDMVCLWPKLRTSVWSPLNSPPLEEVVTSCAPHPQNTAHSKYDPIPCRPRTTCRSQSALYIFEDQQQKPYKHTEGLLPVSEVTSISTWAENTSAEHPQQAYFFWYPICT